MGAYSDAVLALSPARYYRLGELSGTTATDETGTANGTYNGSPTLAQAGPLAGDSDTAVAFDGTDDYVGCGAAVTATTEVCLMCWYKAGATADNTQRVLSNGTDNYSLGVGFAQNSFQMDGNYSPFPSLGFSVDLTSGWHFLVAQRTAAGNFELYHNGKLVAQAARGAAAGVSGNLEIGRFSGSILWTRATLDEVAVFSSALTADQIAALYSIGSVEFLSGWGKRKAIRYGSAFPGANLTDFPKLFVISGDSDIAAELAGGGGIAVTEADGETLVPFGLYPSSDPTSGDLILRAKFDLLTGASTGDVIGYLYYDSGQTTSEDKAGTVSNGYAAFVPMEEDPSGSSPQFSDWCGAADLVASNLDSTDTVAGQVGQAVRFDDSATSKAEVSGVSGLPTGATDAWTISCWHRTRALVSLSQYWGFGGRPDDGAPTNGAKRRMLCFNGHYYFWGESADWDTGVNFHADDSWHHVAITCDGSDLRLYVDGALAAGPSSKPSFVPAGDHVTAGSHHPSGSSPDASIDECSISEVARSADWLGYAYDDDFTNSDTFSLGPEEEDGGGGGSVSNDMAGGMLELSGGLLV